MLDAVGCEILMKQMPAGASVGELRVLLEAWRGELPTALRCPLLLQSADGLPVDLTGCVRSPEEVLDQCEALPAEARVYCQPMFSLGTTDPDAISTFDVAFYPCSMAGPWRPPRGRTGDLESKTDFGRRLAPPPEFEIGNLLQYLSVHSSRTPEAYGNKRNFSAIAKKILAAAGQHLPRYMMPAVLVPIDGIPTSPTGKRDKRKLPAINVAVETVQLGADSVDYEAPTDDLERAVVSLFKRVLTLDPDSRIGLAHNFFDMGGHSLSAGRLAGKILDEFKVKIALQQLFDIPTVNELCEKIRQLRDESGTASVVITGRTESSQKAAKGIDVKVDPVTIELPDCTLAARLFSAKAAVGPALTIIEFSPYPFT